MTYDHDDGAPVWIDLGTRKIAKARKQHACDGCPEGYIMAGEPYTLFVGTSDGEFTLFRMCERSPAHMMTPSGHCPRDANYEAKEKWWKETWDVPSCRISDT